jgi:hypothetical protein
MVADAKGSLGPNISGLAADGPRLWATRDEGELLSLQRVRGRWVSRPGWGNGRALTYPNGSGTPDAESVTATPSLPSAVFVGAERDYAEPNVSRQSILRYDLRASDSGKSGPLRASTEWNLTSLLPSAGANKGLEALALVPNSWLGSEPGVEKGVSGTLTFAVGVEGDGTVRIVRIASGASPVLVTSIDTGLKGVMGLEWNPTSSTLWAQCDDACAGEMAVIRAQTIGAQSIGAPANEAQVTPLVANRLEAPPQIKGLNLEGLALIGPCRSKRLTVVWADDLASQGHSLREASMPCDTGRTP